MKDIKTKKGGEASPSSPNSANNSGNGIHSTPQRYSYIPVDYIRGEITGINPGTLLENLKSLHSDIRINYRSNDNGVLYRETFAYQNIVLNWHEARRVFIAGSLHKFWNGGEHNANQFNEVAFDEVLARLETELLIKPENIRITRLEYGVNISPPLPCKQIINRCFQHRGKEIVQRHTKGEGKFHSAEHDRVTLKIYDKGKQYRLPDEVLRFELKVTKWEQYRKQGILTLADFRETDKTTFVNNLIDRWDEIIFADPTTVYPDKWHRFTNREYWRELREGCRQKFKRRFEKLKHINEIHGANLQGQISNIIRENIQLQQNTEREKSVTFAPFKQKRVCRLTGVPIEVQKRNSFLLSHTGLKHLVEHEPCTFGHLKRAYLTDKWKNAPMQVQVKEIAHNIRNHYFNRHRPYPGARNPAQMKLPLFN